MSIPFKSVQDPLHLYPDTVLTFGQYPGKTIEELINRDPKYLLWLDENTEYILSQETYDRVKSSINIKVKNKKPLYLPPDYVEWMDDPVYLEGLEDIPF